MIRIPICMEHSLPSNLNTPEFQVNWTMGFSFLDSQNRCLSAQVKFSLLIPFGWKWHQPLAFLNFGEKWHQPLAFLKTALSALISFSYSYSDCWFFSFNKKNSAENFVCQPSLLWPSPFSLFMKNIQQCVGVAVSAEDSYRLLISYFSYFKDTRQHRGLSLECD